jgi:hypothetical protein
MNYASTPFKYACLLGAAMLLLAGCGKKAAQADAGDNDSLKVKITDDIVNRVEDVVITLPSPLEMTSLMKKSGAVYNAAMLNSPANAGKYNTAVKQALNMGVYSADLGYVAYFGKTQEAINYLTSMSKLGRSLNVLGAFEMEKIRRMEKNLGNQDSLLFMITEEMENTDSHLRNQQRADHAALILAGGWVEGLYLACMQEKAKPNPLVRTRIGELKLSMNSLLGLLMKFEKQEGFAPLVKDLKELEAIYEKGVKINYDTSKPAEVKSTAIKAPSDVKDGKYTIEPKDGMVSVSTGTTSSVTMDDATLKAIIAKAETMRNGIVQ